MLRNILAACADRQWTVVDLVVAETDGRPPLDHREDGREARTVTVDLGLSGREVGRAPTVLARVENVLTVADVDDDSY